MTRHDLDLAREIREAAETWLYDGDADRPLPGCERLYDLADEVESRCAKLAAAEADRDGALASMNAHRCGDTAERAIKRASAAEAVLAAVRAVCAEVNNVREYGERGSTFQAGANQLARRIVRALAAAEQPEPTDNACRECGIDNPVWFAPNAVWNAVMGDHRGFLCPVCFIRRAEASGLTPTGWQLRPEPAPEQP